MSIDTNLMYNISPFMEDPSVKVKIDRSFSREVVHYGVNHSLKEDVSIDVVVYDQMVIPCFCNFFKDFMLLSHELKACVNFSTGDTHVSEVDFHGNTKQASPVDFT